MLKHQTLSLALLISAGILVSACSKKAPALNWLTIPFDKTAYKTKRVKITLATNVVSGWNEIDAVQLIGE